MRQEEHSAGRLAFSGRPMAECRSNVEKSERKRMQSPTETGCRPELVVALDVPSSAHIGPILERLPSEIKWFKVGLELFTAEGPRALEPLIEKGRNVFLDLKLHDIPRTVERAVASAARTGAKMLTIHASGGREMMRAAACAAKGTDSKLLLVAVTVLTSLSDDDLQAMGVGRSAGDQAIALAQESVACGLDGVVCSVLETRRIRTALGPGPVVVTPGIRPAGGEAGDQKRIADPREAVMAGASFLVVGRPILAARDMGEAARAILREIAGARQPHGPSL